MARAGSCLPCAASTQACSGGALTSLPEATPLACILKTSRMCWLYTSYYLHYAKRIGLRFVSNSFKPVAGQWKPVEANGVDAQGVGYVEVERNEWPRSFGVRFTKGIASTVHLIGCVGNDMTIEYSNGRVKTKDTFQQGKCFSDPLQWWGNRSDEKSPRSRAECTNPSLRMKAWRKAALCARGQAQSVEEVDNNSCGDVRTICKAGQLKQALLILNNQGILADSNTYVCLLRECIKSENLEMGREVHANIVQNGFKPNIFLLNTLVHMYAKCGSVVDARLVFDKMAERDVFTWTMMMAGYSQCGCGREALAIYEQMIQEGFIPNNVTFICVLKACASLGALEKGKEVHASIIKSGIASDIILETALVTMYTKCGSIREACQVFNNMAQRNVVSWSAMIAGYAQLGCGREALEIYQQMIRQGVTPNKVTFICVLNACASLAVLKKGKEVHSVILKAGIPTDIILETALVDMYAKCGSMKDAFEVFNNMVQRNVVSWSAMIAGYGRDGCGGEAWKLYEQMVQEGVMPNEVTFICVLNVCASLADLEKGKAVHADIVKAGIASYIDLENTLVDMYAKCGSLKDARQVFDAMSHRNVASWNAMMGGYGQHGCGVEAFEMYDHMIQEGVTPNKVTFICILNACASLSALEKGKEFHADIIKAGIEQDIVLRTALVVMYAKCGNMSDARQVFDAIAQQDVVSWSAMIAGYAQHGCGRDALQLFNQMQQEGWKPDRITFMSVLSACSHVGLVEEGLHYFDLMIRDHGLTPTVEHFGCIVDLLGRAGRLDEAEDFINKMPVEPGAAVWRALLGACRVYGNLEVAERVADCHFNWDPQKAATYVLLSDSGRCDYTGMMQDKGVMKEPG